MKEHKFWVENRKIAMKVIQVYPTVCAPINDWAWNIDAYRERIDVLKRCSGPMQRSDVS